MRRPVLIDTDPGIDDALALFYALGAPELELVGLTTVFGNVHVETATKNAKWLLAQMGRSDIPVVTGEATPIDGVPHEPAVEVHGLHGFGYHPQIPEAGDTHSTNASDFIYDMALKFQGQLEFVALGPLTNLARAVEKHVELPQLLKSVTIMGGAFDCPGNITPYAEANIYNDPKAAEIVRSNYSNITFVSLDVTDRIPLTRADGQIIGQNSPLWTKFIDDMLRYYVEFYASVGKTEGASLHDPATLIALSHPEFFEFQSVGVNVVVDGEEKGRTQPITGEKPILYTKSAQSEAVRNEFVKSTQHAFI